MTKVSRQLLVLLAMSLAASIAVAPAQEDDLDSVSIALGPRAEGLIIARCSVCHSADLIAQQYRSAFGVDVVVARPFNHLGPRQSELFVGSALARQIAEIKLGKRDPVVAVGNIDPVRDFTDVRDVVRAYIKLLEGAQPYGVFNVCSERGVAIREVLETLCELSGLHIDVRRDPARARQNDVPKIIGSAARLRAATGWSPGIPLRQTLSDLLTYWEERLRTSP